MKTKRIASTVLALVTVCASNAYAQPPEIKPGLWQIQMTLPGGMKGNPMAGQIALMKSQMASLPAEQRREMEKVLAGLQAQGTEFTSDGLRTNQCITKEDIAKFDLMGDKGPDSCTRKSTPVPGGMNVSMQCTQPKMNLDAVVKVQNENAYTFQSTATMAGPDGKMTTQKTSGSGKWLGSDCGQLKPASAR